MDAEMNGEGNVEGGGASTNNVKIRGGGELRQANSMLCNTQEVVGMLDAHGYK